MNFTKLELIKMFKVITKLGLVESKAVCEKFVEAFEITSYNDCVYDFEKVDVEFFVTFCTMFVDGKLMMDCSYNIYPQTPRSLKGVELCKTVRGY